MLPVDTTIARVLADDLRREAARQQLVSQARAARRSHQRPGAVRLAVGQRLVRLGERLAGAPPSSMARRA